MASERDSQVGGMAARSFRTKPLRNDAPMSWVACKWAMSIRPYRSRYRVLLSFQHQPSPENEAAAHLGPEWTGSKQWLLEYVGNGSGTNSVRTAIASVGLNQSRIEKRYTSRYGRNVAGQETAMVTEGCSATSNQNLARYFHLSSRSSIKRTIHCSWKAAMLSLIMTPPKPPTSGCLQQTRRLTSAA